MRVGLVVAALTLPGSLGVFAAGAGAQSPQVVVITEADLDWSVGDEGRMGWSGFGKEVSEDSWCANEGIGGAITTMRFDLRFDFSADPPGLTGTLSGTMGAEVEEDRSSGSFSGPIVDGWAVETLEGWAWGGTADLTLSFVGALTCATIEDDSGAVIDRIVAEGAGERQVTAVFAGGPGAWGSGTGGFRLAGEGGVSAPGEDGWSIDLGCAACDMPLPFPVGSGDAGGIPGVEPGHSSGDEPGGEETVTSAANPPAGDDGSVFSAQAGDGDTDEGGEWSPLGIAILILFLILMALAAGLLLKAAVAAVLTGWRPGPRVPTAGETATLARDVQLGLSEEPPTVTVASPVQPWSSPNTGASPAEFVLQPGEPYTLFGGEGAGPDDWVQVRQGDNVGWVHRSTVQDWHREEIVRPHPPTAGDYRETVGFPQGPDVRPPGGVNYTRRPPGNYQLGPPGADGHRPVYDFQGNLIGSTPVDKVPPSSLRKDVAPPPPLPATPMPPPAP